MTPDQEGALEAVLRRIAVDVAPRLVSEAVEEAEAEVKELIRRRFVRCLTDRLAEADPMSGAQEQSAAAPTTGWYVYGITDGADAVSVSGLSGVEGSTTEAVVQCGFAAVVSEVSARRHGWGVGRDGEPDLDLLRPRVHEHEVVLERILDRGTVLPMRFGTVYPSRTDVHDLLAAHATEIGATMSRLRRKAEWGLTVTWGGDRDLESDRRELDAHGSGSPGRGYLSRQVTERARAEQIEVARQRLAVSLHEAIRAHAADSLVQRPHSPGSDRDRLPLLRASYLVATADTDRFRGAIVEGLEAASAFDVDAELTGPWPPYSFAGLELSGVGP